jgi:DNA polymerase-3 subunit delta
MKLLNKQTAYFLAEDWQNYPIIVLFGHAVDIMNYRRRQILDKSGINLDDAFAFLNLDGAEIAADPSLLTQEACSSSLTLQPRTIAVRGKTADLSKALIQLCQESTTERIADNRVLVIIEDLTTKAALMKHLTQCPWVALVPCYEANQNDFLAMIKAFSEKHQWRIDHEAEALLWQIAQENWDNLNHTLEKLSLYQGHNSSVSIDDVAACSDNEQQYQLLDFALSAFLGEAQTTDHRLSGLLQQKVTEIAIIRQLLMHCLKLLRLHSQAQANGLNRAIDQHQPPIFFKQKTAIMTQCQRFTPQQLQQFLGELLELEANHKQAKNHSQAQLRQWLLRLQKAV